MSWLATYGFCVLGIVISVLLPILWQIVYRYFPKPPARVGAAVDAGPLWAFIAPYVALGAASALTAVLIVAILHTQLTTAESAILAGYAWDSTLQKFRA